MANLMEGGRRMGVAGLTMLKISACLGALALLLSFVPRFFPFLRFSKAWMMLSVLPMMVFPLTISLAILGTVLGVSGYIVRGFEQPHLAESPKRSEAERQA